MTLKFILLMLCHCCRGLRFYHLRCSAIVAPVVTAAAIVVATQAIRRTMTMTIASEHAHDQVSKQTLKVVLLQLSLCLTGSVIQLVLIEGCGDHPLFSTIYLRRVTKEITTRVGKQLPGNRLICWICPAWVIMTYRMVIDQIRTDFTRY